MIRAAHYVLAGIAFFAASIIIGCGGETNEAEIVPTFTADQSNYWRFETVHLRFNADVDTNTLPPRAHVYYNDETNVYESHVMLDDTITFRYNSNTSRYEGKWFMPIDPDLGRYTARVTYASSPSNTNTLAATFHIRGRVNSNAHRPLAVATLEALGTFKGKAGKFYAYGEPEGDWQNLVKVAKFMGADMLAACVGETVGSDTRLTKTNVWGKRLLSHLETLAVETKKEGMLFGAWMHSFFIQFPANTSDHTRGTNFRRLGYTPSLKYSNNGTYVPDWHCSLRDEKRVRDLIDLAKQLNANPNVDFIGLDYIRSVAKGAYELVDEFVEYMDIPVPKEYASWSRKERMDWLRGVRWDLRSQWRYFKAQKAAKITRRIKKEAGVTKKMWTFNLGWHHGWEHGQDPIMFFDAGMEYDFMMMYEAPPEQLYNNMFIRWRGYASGKELNLVPGNSMMVHLLKSKNRNSVEEYTRRVQKSIDDLFTEGGYPRGVFIHDLWRLVFGVGRSKGEFPTVEWLTAGGKAFSDLRAAHGILPVKATITLNSLGWNTREAIVTVTSVSSKNTPNVRVELLQSPNISGGSEVKHIAMIPAKASRKLYFHVTLAPGTREYVMIPILVSWSTRDHRKRLFEYAYVRFPRPKANTNTNALDDEMYNATNMTEYENGSGYNYEDTTTLYESVPAPDAADDLPERENAHHAIGDVAKTNDRTHDSKGTPPSQPAVPKTTPTNVTIRTNTRTNTKTIAIPPPVAKETTN